MRELLDLGALFKAHPTINVIQAAALEFGTIRVKYSIDGGNTKVEDYDFTEGIPTVTYIAEDEIILHLEFRHGAEAYIATFANDTDIRIQGTKEHDFPRNFIREGPNITETPTAAFYAPAPETGVQLHERLMPYLHEAAKAYLDQHIPTAEIAGNSRGVHATTRSAASKMRADTTANAFRLPIGFAAKQLDCHRQGKGHVLSQADAEKLVQDIHEVFTKDDAWWEHHYGHDVRYWNKYHNARQVLLTTPDGTVESIYDIDANIRKNLPKTDRENTELIAQHGEVEFHSLATDWFTKALYGPRERVTERVLTFEEKA